MSFKDYYNSFWGANLELNINLTQLRSVLEQHDNYLEEEVEAWMEDAHYLYKVRNSTYRNEIRISCKFSYTDKRILGDDGRYIGYKDSDGRTLLWED